MVKTTCTACTAHAYLFVKGAGRLDDVAFARALVTVMPVAINRSRVYSTGFSNGGIDTQRGF